jgi:sialic acid synthase SpsE
LAIKYARRSLVAAKDIKKNQEITYDLITIKRPGTGISPKYLESIIGRKAKRDIKEDEIIQWEDLG